MSVRKLKPISPAQRFRVVNGFDALTTDKPEKSLLVPKKRRGGRNNTGKMTIRHVGGGHKKRYRIVDFKRNKFDVALPYINGDGLGKALGPYVRSLCTKSLENCHSEN
jgi:large subunit ribosomal protein L2